jgi:solute carrier family 25 (mitochondrial oxoglutarate transporter), member 11
MGKDMSVFQRGLCALTAGALASLVSTPTDLILVRLQSEATLPPDQRRGYTGFFNASRRIIAEEGVTKLWTGCVPTVSKAMAHNLGMFTTYEEAKQRLSKIFPDSPNVVWFMSSVMAGCAAASLSLPFDNAKTKMQRQNKLKD